MNSGNPVSIAGSAPWLRYPLAIGVAALSVASAHGALLAYDGFGSGYDTSGGFADPSKGASNALLWASDNTSSATFVGQAPVVTGFASQGWVRNNNLGTIASTVYPRLRSLQTNSYQNALGQRVSTTPGEVSVFRNSGSANGTKGFSRNLNVGKSDTYGAATYMSGMFTFTTGVVASYIESSSTNGTDVRAFGMDIGADGSIQARGSAATSVKTDPGLIVAGQSYFFVWKITQSGAGSNNDYLTLFLNPTDLSSEAANTAVLTLGAGDFYVIGSSAWELGKIAFGSEINGGNQFIVDEFRVGTTWEDVAPFTIIPEPGSLSLLAFGAMLVARRRR